MSAAPLHAELELTLSEVFTVFFSWQSDTGRRHGRDLVREALDSAAGTISKDTGNAYRVLILSDTEGEPGLCNIPETILRRLRESDAAVFDLSFVAKTDSEEPKHCSNPNVLFELGYAFSSLGPERLICVLNERHGEAAKQIFDLAHHRRPITFTSPREKVTRDQTVTSLATELETALRGVLKLGLVGGFGGDDELLHQRQLSEMDNTFQASQPIPADSPTIFVSFRPLLFRERRWADAGSLEDVVRRRGPRTDRFHLYPPQQKGTAPMSWGLYNDTYGDAWAMTYAGQYWTAVQAGGWQPLVLSERDARVSPEPPDELELPIGRWVMADHTLSELSKAFQFARNISREFADSERVQIEFSASNIRGRWLHFEHSSSMGPCRATAIHRKFDKTAAEFRDLWMEDFARCGKDFCDLFCRDGRTLTLDDIKTFVNAAGNI